MSKEENRYFPKDGILKIFTYSDRIVKDDKIVYTGISKREMIVNENVIVINKFEEGDHDGMLCKILSIESKDPIKLSVKELIEIPLTVF